MSTPAQNLDTVRRYLSTLEDGTFDSIAELFTPDVVMEQFPNRIYPQGIRSDARQMSEAFAKGRKLLSSQSYEIKNTVTEGDRVAVEVLWIGTLGVAFSSLAVGSQMRCHSSMFFEFKEGKIARQRNYDCFEPW